jgi:hypothetical protein
VVTYLDLFDFDYWDLDWLEFKLGYIELDYFWLIFEFFYPYIRK